MDEDPLLNQSVDLPEDQTGTAPIETPHYSKSSSKKKWIIALVVVVLAASIAGAVWFITRDKPAQQNTNPSPAPVTMPEPEVSDIPASTETKIYDNGPLGVTLTHPVSWQVTETEGKGIRVESPDFTYETASGTTQSGYFRIYIRKGARAQDSKYIGRGVAIKDSEKITYTSPALGQRSDTLLSSFGLDEASTFNYFFIAGNFQLKKGETLGPDYGKEPETFIIAGGYSADELTDDMGFVSVNPDMLADSNAFKQAVEIIKSLELH